MPLTEFPSRRITVDLRGAATDVIPRLFKVEKQCRKDWCWAAVSVSVGKYFNRGPIPQQCDLAFTQLTQLGKNLTLDQCCNGRCEAEIVGPCSIPLDDLESPLRLVGVQGPPPIEGPLEIQAIRDELSAQRPVCAKIQWASGGAHYVVIVGMQTDPDDRVRVSVSDPIYDDSDPDWHTLCDNYGNRGGRWITSYRTA